MTAFSSRAEKTGSASIMIVEDEGIIAGHIATRLEKTGYRVAGTFGCSEEALDQIPELKPDLILMDIRIKGRLDGIDMAAKVREDFDIPVIYLTAHTDRQTVSRAKATGAFGFLTKPIQHTSLATSIEMALQKHKNDRGIREQRDRLETALHTVEDGVAVTDADGKLEFLNRAAENLTGFTSDDAKGRDISSVLPSIDLAGFRADGMPEGLPAGLHAEGSSGKQISVEGEIAAIPAESAAGGLKITGWVLTFRQTAWRREPGRRECRETPAQLRKVGITAASAGRLSAGQQENVNLNEMIHQTGELWRRLAGGSVMWEMKLDPGIPAIHADPAQVKQALMNLIANARDAMPAGGILTVETAIAENADVMLAVRDTGTGMSAELAGRVFEPYFTTKVQGSGAGLGLAITQRIVRDLGGTIGVESEPGKGSAFTIRLPGRKRS